MKSAFGILIVFLTLLMGACSRRPARPMHINVYVYPCDYNQYERIENEEYDEVEE